MKRKLKIALAALICCASSSLGASGGGSGGGGPDPQQAADRAARDIAQAQERAARDASDAAQRSARDAATVSERTTRIEQRFIEDRAKAAADAAHDPAKASEDLAKAEADRQRALSDLSRSGGGSSGSSGSGGGSSGGGSGGSGSGTSGSGSSGGSSGNSGSSSNSNGSGSSSNSGSSDNTSNSGSDSENSSTMHDLAREENPDFDERGFPVRHGEVVALDLGDAGLARAKADGFRVIARDRLETLSGSVTRLELPQGMSSDKALAQLRSIDGGAVFDFTHYYGLQITPQGKAEPGSESVMRRRSGRLTVGMIDTGVAAHPALSGTGITQRRFGTAASGSPQTDHGTAVASILSSEGSKRLMVADVFRGTPQAPFTSADAIAQSLEWMAASGVNVVNISLAGPRNAILDRLIERASGRGMVVVAAAGNGGPTAPPAFPAALGSVVAVTAVDAQSRIYRYANQGDYIAVAARGVGEPAASPGGRIASYSGTSFATPHIAAWMARCLNKKRSSSNQCRSRLYQTARDVGAPGRDPVYGWGIVVEN